MNGPAEPRIRWAVKGSQLQIQLYVNRHSAELTRAILDTFPDLAAKTSELDWKAPLERDGFDEPQDLRFLTAIGCERLADSLRAFWPAGGPVWDALAIGRGGEVVLVEAKSHPAEIYGGVRRRARHRANVSSRLFGRRNAHSGLPRSLSNGSIRFGQTNPATRRSTSRPTAMPICTGCDARAWKPGCPCALHG